MVKDTRFNDRSFHETGFIKENVVAIAARGKRTVFHAQNGPADGEKTTGVVAGDNRAYTPAAIAE